MEKIKVMETCLRDGHQSLIATRMTTAEMLPIIETLDKVGYHSLEMWGGATFDAAVRFLKEDPWERLREIRKRAKNTKLQMLLRGQNLLGYRHYADDIVEKFVKKSIENGIDIIRIFDALNDVRNLKAACEATKKYGGHAQLALSYTISPVHTIEYYKNLALEMEKIGADSIAIKDMSGILLPEVAYELVKELKSVLKVPVEVHTHATAGLASMTYIKAIEAGADIIDTAISPFAGGTSQPATESIVRALAGTDRETGFDLEILKEIAEYFKPIRAKYLQNGTLNPQALMTEPSIVEYQLPGGMLSNLLSQLKAQKAEHKYEEVLKEIPRVRADLGYPPLVTPLSQMVGTQAVFNVLTGSRYKMVPNEIKDYVKGLYGKSPVPIADDIKEKIIGKQEPFTGRPADLIAPEFEKLKEESKDFARTEEDVLTYALFPQVAKEYLTGKYMNEKKENENVAETRVVKEINVFF
ncbi:MULTISPECIES: oxaloacetate decarboxylase subunit alpha [Fusobacterium]|uniref:oxaloacetate decarboxylase subunit alpha n=1 Tax=Fusobacterium TaxID=848 RepID=UPI0025C1DA89|nr:oxaloacetate decarboxylase subunit alpha [Fusobacterium sp.]MCI7223926.1 oxaloacetate decarboxylase subunit alpha [Fusobacterium sp.]MDD7409924.1 oxaloacetate decarboxylase subunit alpha [Fusobacteriaceae bacterium]MDY5712505.1 oxaloacetate decarboxylase subunit alpha [Fusobacterium gastrosuis]